MMKKPMMRKPMHIEVKKGALHKELGISEKKGISTERLEKAKATAKKTGDMTLLKRTMFALNARKWKH